VTGAGERQAEPQRRRGPYAKTAQRRLQIIGAAAEAFGESGYESASIRDIAERLGLSHAAVTFHFKTKRELLAAVLEHQQQGLSPMLDRAVENPLEFLAFIVRLFKQREATPERAELFLMLAAEAWSPDHPARDYMLRHYARLRSVVGGVFRALADRGLLRTGVDADEAARFGVALTDGLQLQWLYAPDEVPVGDDLASFFLQALNADGRRRLHRLLA
jgi:AcrR family transcriptional regulator